MREICVQPRGEHAYAEAEWRDALVLVERGAIEVEFIGGGCCRFVRGDVLFLSSCIFERCGTQATSRRYCSRSRDAGTRAQANQSQTPLCEECATLGAGSASVAKAWATNKLEICSWGPPAGAGCCSRRDYLGLARI